MKKDEIINELRFIDLLCGFCISADITGCILFIVSIIYKWSTMHTIIIAIITVLLIIATAVTVSKDKKLTAEL